MKRMIVRHLSGSKVNQVEEFPLGQFLELTVGRDPAANIRYDPDRDDLVGRIHAKIVCEGSDPDRFSLVDARSRNGTFINQQRIDGAARIVPGDVVRLGPGGPEFQFDLEPRPAAAVRPTRIGSEISQGPVSSSPVPPTVGVQFAGSAGVANPSPWPGKPGSPSSGPVGAAPITDARVGRATVERMITRTQNESQKKFLLVGGVGLLVVAAGVFGAMVYQQGADAPPAQIQAQADAGKMTPSTITAKYSSATVFVQHSWQLIQAATGTPLLHAYRRNAFIDSSGRTKPLIPEQGEWVAMYRAVQSAGGVVYEPLLTSDSDAVGKPIGFSLTGTGFCVTSDGFIISNAHVAAPWKTPYQFDANALPGVLVDERGQPRFQGAAPSVVDQLTWIPANSWQFGSTEGGQGQVVGRSDELNVTFPGTELRTPAKLARVSDRHDVAMLKIDLPGSVSSVVMNDTYNSSSPGDPITVLGFPAGAPKDVGIITGKDAAGLSAVPVILEIPHVHVTTGNIAGILRQREGAVSGVSSISTIGDVYTLTVNSTGSGNSGGPVFNDRGEVIAIFTYGLRTDFQASAAVPIKYAMEIMGISSLTK